MGRTGLALMAWCLGCAASEPAAAPPQAEAAAAEDTAPRPAPAPPSAPVRPQRPKPAAAPAPVPPAGSPAERPSTPAPAPPATKPAFDWRRQYKTADTSRVLAEFRRSEGTGAYEGRFEYFHYLGRPGLLALIRVAFDAIQTRQPDREILVLAIQALADQRWPEAVEALEEIRTRFSPSYGGEETEWVLDHLAYALHRRGKPALLQERIAALHARLRVGATGTHRARTQLNLAHRYLHAGETAKAVAWFERTAAQFPMFHGNAHYNAACAWSKAGAAAKALASLRRAILTPSPREQPYDDLEWMRKDGDLYAARDQPEFEYLCAALTAKHRIGAKPPLVHSDIITTAIDALRAAHEHGYRISEPGDYWTVFSALHGRPEFERLWKAMGGATPR